MPGLSSWRAESWSALELLLIAVCCAADDLPAEPAGNARRRVSDAEVVTLAVAQALLDIPSDRVRARRSASVGRAVARAAPAECGRSVQTTRRSQLADACSHGHSRRHSRRFGGMRPASARRSRRQAYGAAVLPPARKTEPDTGPHLSSIHQRIESIFCTLQDQLGPRTPRSPHPARPARPHRGQTPGLQRRPVAQPTASAARTFADLNAQEPVASTI
jgi:hypothetical protein